MTFKFKKPKLKFHTRSIIAGAFVLLICVAAYTDSQISKKTKATGTEYIYTSGTTTQNSEHTKILGEAAFVDSIQSMPESTETSKTESTQAGAYDTYFSAMKTDRQHSREEAYEMLKAVVESADSMPDVKEKAYNEMMTIANNITVESNIQSMVKAKGFEDCLAVINGDNINVVVKSKGLLVNEVAQIKEIAVNESGFSANNIKVVEKN